MKHEIRQLPYRTEKDIRQAEMLKSVGWQIVVAGIYTVLMERSREAKVYIGDER